MRKESLLLCFVVGVLFAQFVIAQLGFTGVKVCLELAEPLSFKALGPVHFQIAKELGIVIRSNRT